MQMSTLFNESRPLSPEALITAGKSTTSTIKIPANDDEVFKFDPAHHMPSESSLQQEVTVTPPEVTYITETLYPHSSLGYLQHAIYMIAVSTTASCCTAVDVPVEKQDFVTMDIVGDSDTLHAILALVLMQDLKLQQMDVKGAYLNGTLHETIYMRQPEGCEDGMG